MSRSITTLSQKAVSVDIKQLCKRFGSYDVLHDVSFSIQPGEIFVIMGPSGAGKSVLLRCMIGLEKPTSGKILIEGLDASEQSTHQKLITSMVFQSGALFNSLTVFENLAFYPREHGAYHNKNELTEKVFYTLKILSLEKAAHKYPSELSGGMKKRVAIARALIMEPQLLLYDEPTSELDPTSSANISELIGTLKEEFGVTSVVVSHDRDLSLSIANRIALIIEGKVRILATPKEVRESQDPVVQDFLNPKIDIHNPRFRKTKENL
ncbi:MAG: ABC transporter related protein [Candidatus Roizmanbacteria bacterium GW2011_GWC2_41_7]|uniref:ABC transporter related protein n=1 Tax=Candidatus Roizmanbacteria bacterium GW2011_GWC2_41_7 TaxID=1618487 RepID=A0A0G1ABW6_9BACT|nr:MAG: ABC transporter related protein [Candidatus Roizmanbacteria bacterium GW2011_GWC2_41_7]